MAHDYPGITLEIVADEGFVNIVEHGFDAGIRLGEDIHNDMRRVRISPDLRMAIAATPEYFQQHGKPSHQEDLLNHHCIGWRQIASGELHKWKFQKAEHSLSVSVNGPLILDDASLMLKAALAHVGIAFAVEEDAAECLATGQLVHVLEDWCTAFPGFYLYYPNRRNHPVALTTVINRLRYPKLDVDR